MRPSKGKSPSGDQPEKHQERHEQPFVGGAGKDEPYESHTGRHGALENIEGTAQPGEKKEH